MKIASVDIGTNSFILLIANIENGKIIPIRQVFAIPRLGEDIIKNFYINTEALERSVYVLRNFRKIIQEYQPDIILPVATAVLRDVGNSIDVQKLLSASLEHEIKVICSEDEAYFSFLGVISKGNHLGETFTTLDIGGGSTEIITGSESGVSFNSSLLVGAAKVRDLFFEDNLYPIDHINKAKDYINKLINKINPDKIKIENFIGVGGTITTLAFIKSGLEKYDSEVVDRIILDKLTLQQIFEQLCKLNPKEITEKFGINPKRADILLPGQLILISIMEKFEIDSIQVSSRGLRFGVIQNYLKKFEH